MTGAFQENLSNHPAVLLSKDRGIERIGKRDDERSISGVCNLLSSAFCIT
jgi:hypothetical protein